MNTETLETTMPTATNLLQITQAFPEGLTPADRWAAAEEANRLLTALQPAIMAAVAKDLPRYAGFFREDTPQLVVAQLLPGDFESDHHLTLRWAVVVPEELETFCEQEDAQLQERATAAFASSGLGRVVAVLEKTTDSVARALGAGEKLDEMRAAQKQAHIQHTIAAPVDTIVSAALHAYLRALPEMGAEITQILVPSEGRALDMESAVQQAKATEVDSEYLCWVERCQGELSSRRMAM